MYMVIFSIRNDSVVYSIRVLKLGVIISKCVDKNLNALFIHCKVRNYQQISCARWKISLII